MKKLQVVLSLVAVFLLMSLSASAQTYDVDYKNQPVEQVIKDLRKQTGYQFVYKKETVIGVDPITVTLKNATLEQVLNRVFFFVGIDYEIAKGKTIILKKADKNRPYFKKQVSGLVTDENEDPLPGVTVMVKGTNNGVSTDIDGAFSIFIEGSNPELEFSYVGMKNKTVRLSPKTEKFIMVKLESDETILDEVLVTGYQNIKRENATGSYQLISSKKLDERHTGTIVENLEGQIPGLMSYNNGLNGGGENALTIRGISSFQAKTNPLVVVDGLPIEGSIETINPYNIENITVLKDASAAAIYGARASNGVIVITTKRAQQEKLEVDFSTDITISEKQNYDNFGWANAEEYIELEKYNFNHIKQNSPNTMESILNQYQSQRHAVSPIQRLLISNYLGEISDSEMNTQLNNYAKNDYRKEWQDAKIRNQVLQQYNLALRTRGKYLNSSIAMNYKTDNLGVVKEHNNVLTFSYRGDLKATKWLDLSFGTNIISGRTKNHYSSGSDYSGINSFRPYMSMYNADGSRAKMEAEVMLSEPAFQNPLYGLKDASYNLLDEIGLNMTNSRDTNIRSFVSATATILPGWTASANFQYEDTYSKSNSYLKADSYQMRYLYDIYTGEATEMVDGYDPETYEPIQVPMTIIKHYIPEGGQLITTNHEGAYYTFRAQTSYNHIFADKHEVEALAGFEFRESHTKSYGNVLLGYDDQTQSNRNNMVNYGVLKDINLKPSVLGVNYSMVGAPDDTSFKTTDILHRFYSLYFTGNYTYDHRYSASFSYRVDKTDLFGADPEFRGRPLWSVGASWNIHNEDFMKQYSWIDALKLRASYGLTGNIDSSVSSYLTATLSNEYIYGHVGASLDTPPNDQLRWEKTASYNLGLDFSFWSNRLSGAFDYYHKKGSDLLTMTDLDPTTGWSSLTINNGEMVNNGVELQLNGEILKPATRNSLGINASFNISYNNNKVTKVTHEATSGHQNLMYYTLHKDHPVHSIYAYQFAGIQQDKDNGKQFITWKGHDGVIHNTSVDSDEFTVDDPVYCGSLDPKIMSSFTPEITYAGFSLSAMFSFYGGHHMRANTDRWDSQSYANGYREGVLASDLDFWRTGDGTKYLGNGYLGGYENIIGYFNTRYMDIDVVPADYLKLRNLVIGYDFSKRFCKKLNLNAIRLRFQMNNLCTWVKNDLDIDPEANNPVTGSTGYKTPRSYTMSLRVNF